MKKISFSILFLVITYLTFAQGTTTFTIILVDKENIPMKKTEISLIETTTKDRIVGVTDDFGKKTFVLTTGKEWAVNVLQIKNCRYIKVPPTGTSTGNTTIAYDYAKYERTNRPPVDRNKLNIQIINQNGLRNLSPTNEMAVISLKFAKLNGRPLTNFQVNLTCYKIAKSYSCKTNDLGKAEFLVPINNEFEVDIDGIESFYYVDIKESATYSRNYTYEPNNIQEINNNDTITQIIPPNYNGTSSRAYVALNISTTNKDIVFKDDMVYLDMLNSTKVYKAKIDDKGNVFFLLPIKRQYMIHLKFERDVDVIDLSRVFGIAKSTKTIIYRPNPRLQYPERYIPKIEDIFVKDFRDFIKKQSPLPVGTEPFKLTCEWGNQFVNNTSKEAVLKISIRAQEQAKATLGKPLNIAFVVDKSGSMAGYERIGALKKGLLDFSSKLRNTDVVSLVSFSDTSTVLFPAQSLSNRTYLTEMIEDINADGSTNIYSGMVAGYEQVLKNYNPKAINRVVLLTDGHDNTRTTETIVNKSKQYNLKGIELSAIGVGADYNQALLSLLATSGGGLLNFIGESGKIKNVFENELASLLSPLATNLQLEIICNNKIVYKQIYGNDNKSQIGKVILKEKNIYAGLERVFLVSFNLKDANSEIERSPIIIRGSYYDIIKKTTVPIEEKAYLKWSPETGTVELILEAEYKKIYAIAIINQSLQLMAAAYTAKNYDEALKVIESVKNQIQKLYPKAKDSDVNQLIISLDAYSKILIEYKNIKK